MRRTAVAVTALLLAVGSTPALASVGIPKLANVEAGPHLAALYNDSPSLSTGSNTLTVKIADLPIGHTVSLMLVGPSGQHVAVPLTPVTILDTLDDDGEHSHADGADDHAAPATDQHTGSAAGSHAAPAVVEVAVDDHAHAARPTPPPPVDPHAHGAPRTPAPSVDSHAHAAQPVPTSAVSDAHSHDVAAADGHGVPAADDHDAHGGPTEMYYARGSVSLPATGAWLARLTIRDADGEELVGEVPVVVEQGGPSRLYLGFTGSLIGGSLVFGMIQRRRQRQPVALGEGR